MDDAKREALQSQIRAVDSFLESQGYRDLTESISEDIDGAITRVTEIPPETIGQLVAHFVDIGRIAGLRQLVERPKDARLALQQELDNL